MPTDDAKHDSHGALPRVGVVDPVDVATRSAGAAGESCPSCDAPGAWSLSRRHRYNPFGGVLCVVLAFWTALAGGLIGFGYLPAVALAALGVLLVAARRTALVCQVCGFVKTRG